MDGRKRRRAHMSYNIYLLYCVCRVHIWQKSTQCVVMYIVQGSSPSTINPIFPLIMNLFNLYFSNFQCSIPYIKILFSNPNDFFVRFKKDVHQLFYII